MSSLPSIYGWCPTFARPQQVANVLKMWEEMEYDGDRELIILDDGGQFKALEGKVWPGNAQIISVSRRFSSFGEKQNACCSFSTSKHDLLVNLEDDDFLAPWTLEAHVAAFQKGNVSIPKRFFIQLRNESLRLLVNKRLHDGHAGWAYERNLFRKVGGYPWIDIPTDMHLWERFKNVNAVFADSTESHPPYFVSRPFTAVNHLSRIRHDDPWSEAGKVELEPVFELSAPESQRDYVKEMCEF